MAERPDYNIWVMGATATAGERAQTRGAEGRAEAGRDSWKSFAQEVVVVGEKAWEEFRQENARPLVLFFAR